MRNFIRFSFVAIAVLALAAAPSSGYAQSRRSSSSSSRSSSSSGRSYSSPSSGRSSGRSYASPSTGSRSSSSSGRSYSSPSSGRSSSRSYASPSTGSRSFSSSGRSYSSHSSRRPSSYQTGRPLQGQGSRPIQVDVRRPDNHPGARPADHAYGPRRPVAPPYHPAHFYTFHPHYYGYCVHVLPHYEVMRFYGRDYYFYDNVFYRFYDGYYYICRPPYGYTFGRALVDVTLTACAIAAITDAITTAVNVSRTAAVANTNYYYNDGSFYVEGVNDQYEVVVPPSGALVKTLPNDYQTVQINGLEYYLVDDTLYRLTVYDQEPYFEVLGQMPEGWTPSDGTAS